MNASIIKGALARVLQVLKLQIVMWTHEKIGWGSKARFTFGSLAAPFTGSVNYLGENFTSDNKVALLLLPEYARLVADVIAVIEDSGESAESLSVLDVGANIGQFGATASRMFGCMVVSIEPNPVCWPYLAENGAGHGAWSLQKRGLADVPRTLDLYFVRNKSAQGSFSRDNAGRGLISGGEVESVSVSVGPYLSDTTVATAFDLVKIDVEGFELEVIRGLAGVDFEFLLVEIDEVRDHGFTQLDLENVARDALGLVLHEVWCDRKTIKNGPRNVLYRVVAAEK